MLSIPVTIYMQMLTRKTRKAGTCYRILKIFLWLSSPIYLTADMLRMWVK